MSVHPEHSPRQRVGARLRAAIEAAHVRRDDVARAIGVSPSVLERMLSGTTRLGVGELARLPLPVLRSVLRPVLAPLGLAVVEVQSGDPSVTGALRRHARLLRAAADLAVHDAMTLSEHALGRAASVRGVVLCDDVLEIVAAMRSRYQRAANDGVAGIRLVPKTSMEKCA